MKVGIGADERHRRRLAKVAAELEASTLAHAGQRKQFLAIETE